MLGKHLMTQTTEHDDQFDIDSVFDKAIEEKAAELEVTVDYYMMEFM